MGSPFKSRNVHLFQDFSGNGIRHVMGFPVIHTEKLGQGGGGGSIARTILYF